MKIGLGTVQFGSHYGISNISGTPSIKEIEKIIDTAYQNGGGLTVCFKHKRSRSDHNWGQFCFGAGRFSKY